MGLGASEVALAPLMTRLGRRKTAAAIGWLASPVGERGGLVMTMSGTVVVGLVVVVVMVDMAVMLVILMMIVDWVVYRCWFGVIRFGC